MLASARLLANARRAGLRHDRGYRSVFQALEHGALSRRLSARPAVLAARAAAGGSAATLALALRGVPPPTECSQLVQASASAAATHENYAQSFARYERAGFRRALRMLWRIVSLAFLYSPLVLGVPFALALGWLLPGLEDALWTYALHAVHRSGPAYIKLAQWASSRNDLFPVKFCETFSKLHDQVFPHSWQLTEQVLSREMGPDWAQRLELEPQVIGSGCIAQVYRGKVVVDPASRKAVDVAVKVIHPGVEALVTVDIDIIRTAAQLLSMVPALKWLSLPDVVEDFALQMFWQLDLRQEARNLARLKRNFAKDEAIVIPEPFLALCTRDLLIETFQPGVPIASFIESDACDAAAAKELSLLGMNSMAKMIFIDNFVHCDLHPGNILISGKTGSLKMIFLDAGIVKELRPDTHKLLLNILQAFLQWDGSSAGRLMIENAAEQRCADVDGFCAGIQKIIDDSKTMPFFQHFAEYTANIFNLACTHKVKLEGNFITIALAMKICEGLSIRLDPDIQMVQGCIPWLFKAQLSHGVPISELLFSTHGISMAALKNLTIS